MDESELISKFLRQKKIAAIVPSILMFLLVLHISGMTTLPEGTALVFGIFVLASLVAAALVRNRFVTVESVSIVCPKCKKPMHSKILKCEICGTETTIGNEEK